MVNYQFGKIYKISDINDEMVYIGSTSEKKLCKRMACHRGMYKLNKNKCSSRSIFDKYGMDNVRIELIEAFPCATKEELLKREGHYIRSIECINKNIAGRTKAEYNLAHAEDITYYNIEYRATHKDKI